jgi:hypothetical protein
MHIKKAKLSKKQSKSLHKLYKRKQSKKRVHATLKGGASDCEAAYVTEPGFSIPDNGSIKGFILPSKKAILRASGSCKSNHP